MPPGTTTPSTAKKSTGPSAKTKRPEDGMARLYADEDVDYPAVVQLRSLGHDVLTAQEAGQGRTGVDSVFREEGNGLGSPIAVPLSSTCARRAWRPGCPRRPRPPARRTRAAWPEAIACPAGAFDTRRRGRGRA